MQIYIKKFDLYSVMKEYSRGKFICITIGRNSCYINTPAKIYYNTDFGLPLYCKKLLNDVLCK